MVKSLVPWTVSSPRVFDTFRREMNQLMEQLFGASNGGEGVEPLASPHANVAESAKEYEVTLDLPGVKPEDVSVELKENQLWITGQRKIETEQKEKTYHRIESYYGQFRRVIPFPEAVNPDRISATYKDGVLTVTVAKDEAAQPKKIEVKSV